MAEIIQTSDYARLIFRWNTTYSSAITNKSTVEYTLYFKPIIVVSSTKTLSCQVTFNGISKGGSLAQGVYSYGEEYPLISGSIEVQHNPDGTKTVPLSFWLNGKPFADWTKITYDGSAEITPLNRKATITGAPDFTDEDSPTITYINPAGSAVSSLQVCISSDGYAIEVPYRAVPITSSGVTGSYTFNFTDGEKAALWALIKQGNTTTVRFYIKTEVDGVTSLHSMTKTLTLVNYTPVISVGIYDSNATTRALTGYAFGKEKFIKYHSNAQCTISGTGRKGATITNTSVKNGTLVISNQPTCNFIELKDATFTYSVTDSRGHTETVKREYELIPYIPLTASLKIDSFTPTGEMKVTLTGKYFQGFFGAKSNYMNVAIILKSADGSTTIKTFTLGKVSPTVDSVGNYTYSYTMTGIDYQQNYTVEAHVTDALTPELSLSTVAAPIPVFDWGKEDFNFNVPVSIKGAPIADWIVETGQEAMGSNGTWYWEKWNSGKAVCYGMRNFGKSAINVPWGSLYENSGFSQDFPYGLFIDVPMMQITVGRCGMGVMLETAAHTTKDNTGHFFLVRPTAATTESSDIHFHCIGRWK